MTISEFRAWLDGFSEGVRDAPTPEQWARILEKLADVREPLPALPVFPHDLSDPFCADPRKPSWPGIHPMWSTTGGGSTGKAVAWI